MKFILDTQGAATMYSALFRVKTSLGFGGGVCVHAGRSAVVKQRVNVQAITDAIDTERPIWLEGITYHKYPQIEPEAYRVRLFHPTYGAWIPKHRMRSLGANQLLASRLQNGAGVYWAVEILDSRNNVVMYRRRGESNWRSERTDLEARLSAFRGPKPSRAR